MIDAVHEQAWPERQQREGANLLGGAPPLGHRRQHFVDREFGLNADSYSPATSKT